MPAVPQLQQCSMKCQPCLVAVGKASCPGSPSRAGGQSPACPQAPRVGSEPQPRRGTGHTTLLLLLHHLKQHLPSSHQSAEKVNSCVQSAFKMKVCFISLLSATAVILTEMRAAGSFLFSQLLKSGSPDSSA